ncbi:MAG: class I SAM-dependent methyltransferase [Bacteroidales bacterium]|nr:class I SAM-dependent methyltransferase [Bacteroidales bacterium]
MSNKCPWCQSEKAHTHLSLKDYFLTQEPFDIMVCDDCGLLYTTPKPSDEKLGDYYKSEAYYSHQENKKGFIPRVYEAVKSVNLKHKIAIATQGKEPGRLLDIGCGVGDFLHYAEQNGWQCTGAEPSEDAASIAKKRIKAEIMLPKDLEKLPDESFDVITMWHVLEHVSDLQWQVNQLNRLLKKGGRLVIALPNFRSYDAQYYKDKWAAYDVPRHLNHFSQDSIAKIFNINCLVKIPTQKLVWDAFYISFMSEKYRQKSLPLLRGIYRGMISNLKAKKSGEWSSLVYVFEKRI